MLVFNKSLSLKKFGLKIGPSIGVKNFGLVTQWSKGCWPISMIVLHFTSLQQGCIFRLTCSHRELTKDHVLTSAYVKILTPSREMP